MKKKKSKIRNPLDFDRIDKNPVVCWCPVCMRAHVLHWVNGQSGRGATVVFPVTTTEWAKGYVTPKRAMPFYMDDGRLVLTDAYPIVAH